MRTRVIQNCGLAVILAAGLGSTGCANMSDSQRRVTTGAGIGAATGAVIRGDTRGVATGAAIGAAGGWIYDRNQRKWRRRR
ncbi:lipoprotein [Microbulbifer aggregans]|uniref:Lipoprotein n=1 Tax=Microbulbifer aggregans TaxID=1769779 RepID=A0A1C9WC29_9GAMM|nr:YMGG-like glycine zipper-containing protein [Microbulbifer aggregans]AOS98709.1 lipoprotein [Microbulbifer aggregans]